MAKLPDLGLLIWGDATQEEKLRTMRVGYRIVVTGSLLWAFGWFSPWLPGFARADEVDDKVQAAVEPIRSEVGQVSRKVGDIDSRMVRVESQNTRILKGQIATELRELNKIKCTSTDDHQRARLDVVIEERQEEYAKLGHDRYPLPPCRDL